jgi:glycosyltransferase involved in cell wall biosynthesis
VTSFVTVIIPALNEELHIGNCLKGLQNQTYPKDKYEVIVVDNGSEDNTVDEIQKCGVTLLYESQPSAYCARNRAIINSSSDLIAFIDADCIAEPQWLENFVIALENSDALIAGGMIIYDVLKNTFANRLLVERNQPEQRRISVCQHHAVAGGNMIVRRSVFSQYGLFKSAAYSSDIEFSQRLAQVGIYPLFVDNAIVHHQCDLSNWDYLWRSYHTKKSQVLHNRQSQNWGSFIRALGKIPWQPGLRFFRQSSSTRLLIIHWAEWSYRWLERWFAYAGHVEGHWVAVVHQPRGFEGYSPPSSSSDEISNDS